MKERKRLMIGLMIAGIIGAIGINILEYLYNIPIMMSFSVLVVTTLGTYLMWQEGKEYIEFRNEKR